MTCPNAKSAAGPRARNKSPKSAKATEYYYDFRPSHYGKEGASGLARLEKSRSGRSYIGWDNQITDGKPIPLSRLTGAGVRGKGQPQNIESEDSSNITVAILVIPAIHVICTIRPMELA